MAKLDFVTLSPYLSRLLYQKKWIYFFYQHRKYYAFLLPDGKTVYLSEKELVIYSCIWIFLLILAIREILKRLQIRKRVTKLVTRLRGGKTFTFLGKGKLNPKLFSLAVMMILKLKNRVLSPFLLENGPLLAAMVTAVVIVVQVDLKKPISNRLTTFVWMLMATTSIYSLVQRFLIQVAIAYPELVGSQCLDLDCPDSVPGLPHLDTGPEVDASSSKLFSTSPNLDKSFVPQEDVQAFEIQTLDETLKGSQKLSGQKTLTWIKDRPKSKFVQSASIPLKDRMKTLADLEPLDQPIESESVVQTTRIQRAIRIRESLKKK